MYNLDELTITGCLNEFADLLHYARDALAVIGVVYSSKLLFNALCASWTGLRTYVIPRLWYTSDFSQRYGKWAVITGASEGIGKAYACKLAERKMNVFLISRSMTKLRNAAAEIESTYGVEVKCFAMDLRQINIDENYRDLEHQIQSLDIGVLVNNTGAFYDQLQYYLTVPKDQHQKIIDLNLTATVVMTYMVLPYMVKKRSGAVINIGSLSSVYPTPLMTTYSAAKSFTAVFSKALDCEYASEGITVQCVRPGYVSTSMTHNMKTNFLVCSPDDFVDSALRTLGVSRYCYGHWKHALLGALGEVMPERCYMWAAMVVNTRLYTWLSGVQISSKKTN